MANLCRRSRETSQSCDIADPQSGHDVRRGRQGQLVLRLKENSNILFKELEIKKI
jgi:hypothetical protein